MLYGVDVASYQGHPDWRRVHDAGIGFAFSKVTQSTNYTNPTWAHNRAGMLALGGDFLPGAYHFLTSTTDPAAQARYFLDRAGDLDAFAVALDVEPTTGSRPTAAQARAWVAEFKRLTGGHPVLGYYPRWYWEQTGRPDLSFFDTIWQSHYVSGTGSPSSLYAGVPASWWTAFGGEQISILQFSSSATVPGISGRCDINAYRGSLQELRAIALGGDMLTDDDIKRAAKAAADAVWAHTFDDPAQADPAVRAPAGTLLWRAALTLTRMTISPDSDADTSAIVAGILAGLSPEAIARAVAAVLPPELARQVLDQLTARLQE